MNKLQEKPLMKKKETVATKPFKLQVHNKRFNNTTNTWYVDFSDFHTKNIWKVSDISIPNCFFEVAGIEPVAPVRIKTPSYDGNDIPCREYLIWNFKFNECFIRHLSMQLEDGSFHPCQSITNLPYRKTSFPLNLHLMKEKEKETKQTKFTNDGSETPIEEEGEIAETNSTYLFSIQFKATPIAKYEGNFEDLIQSCGKTMDEVIEYYNHPEPTKFTNDPATNNQKYRQIEEYVLCAISVGNTEILEHEMLVMAYDFESLRLFGGKCSFSDFFHAVRHVTMPIGNNNDEHNERQQYFEKSSEGDALRESFMSRCLHKYFDRKSKGGGNNNNINRVLCFYSDFGDCTYEMELLPFEDHRSKSYVYYAPGTGFQGTEVDMFSHNELMKPFLSFTPEREKEIETNIDREITDKLSSKLMTIPNTEFSICIREINFAKELVRLVFCRYNYLEKPTTWSLELTFSVLQEAKVLPRFSKVFDATWLKKKWVSVLLTDFFATNSTKKYNIEIKEQPSKHLLFIMDCLRMVNNYLKHPTYSYLCIQDPEPQAFMFTSVRGKKRCLSVEDEEEKCTFQTKRTRNSIEPEQQQQKHLEENEVMIDIQWVQQEEWKKGITDVLDKMAGKSTASSSSLLGKLVSLVWRAPTTQRNENPFWWKDEWKLNHRMKMEAIVHYPSLGIKKLWYFSLDWTQLFPEWMEKLIVKNQKNDETVLEEIEIEFQKLLAMMQNTRSSRSDFVRNEFTIIFPGRNEFYLIDPTIAWSTIYCPKEDEVCEKSASTTTLSKKKIFALEEGCKLQADLIGFFSPRIALIDYNKEECWSFVIDKTAELKSFIKKSRDGYGDMLNLLDRVEGKTKNFINLAKERELTSQECVQHLQSEFDKQYNKKQNTFTKGIPQTLFTVYITDNREEDNTIHISLVSAFDVCLFLEFTLTLDTDFQHASHLSKQQLVSLPFKETTQQEAILLTTPGLFHTPFQRVNLGTGYSLSGFLNLPQKFPWIEIAAKQQIERIPLPSEIVRDRKLFEHDYFAPYGNHSLNGKNKRNFEYRTDPLASTYATSTVGKTFEYIDHPVEEDLFIAKDRDLIGGFTLSRGIYEISFDYISDLSSMKNRKKPGFVPAFTILQENARMMIVGEEQPCRIYVQNSVFFAFLVRSAQNSSEELIQDMLTHYPVAAVVRKIA